MKSKLDVNYSIETYPLPFISYEHSWGKPGGYLDQIKSKVIIVNGNGSFYSFDKGDLNSKKIEFEKINTNIKDIIKDSDFYIKGSKTVRDLLIVNDIVLISYAKKQSDDCYNMSILISEFNLKMLQFKEFFAYPECQGEFADVSKSGGRMVYYKDNKILLSTGEFGKRPLAQDENSLFGKIISIDLKSKHYEIISIGHRNPQGLYYDKDKNVIISTDHGPMGGDEININLDPNHISFVENYGWPISSYGEHYDGEFYDDAPLHKSHKDYGFVEPIKYYTPAIGISEIRKIPNAFNENFTNDFFVASMGWDIEEGDLSIHHLRFNQNYDQIIFEDTIPIMDRIRDIAVINYDNNTYKILLVLESSPSLAELQLEN